MNLSDITVPALAYLGDSVLEVAVRTYLVTERGLSTSAHLNRAALDMVRRAIAMTSEPSLFEDASVQEARNALQYRYDRLKRKLGRSKE